MNTKIEENLQFLQFGEFRDGCGDLSEEIVVKLAEKKKFLIRGKLRIDFGKMF